MGGKSTAIMIPELPPLNQLTIRNYITTSLCLPAINGLSVDDAIDELRYAVRKMVIRSPFLGCHIVVDSDTCRVSLEEEPFRYEAGFEELRGHPDTGIYWSYETLKAWGFPPTSFEGPELLQGCEVTRATGGGPVLQVRFTKLDTGMILWLYLHSAIADTFGMATIMRYLTGWDGSVTLWPVGKKLTPMCLQAHLLGKTTAKEQMFLRGIERCYEYAATNDTAPGRYHGVRLVPQAPKPAPPLAGQNASKIFVFKHSCLAALLDTIHEHESDQEFPLHVAFLAFIWSQITNARVATFLARHPNSGKAKLTSPVNWRRHVFDADEQRPALFGIANVLRTAEIPTAIVLQAGHHPAHLCHLVRAMWRSYQEVDEAFIKQRITLAGGADPRRMYLDLDLDDAGHLYVDTWSELVAESDMCGIKGWKPDAVRKFQSAPCDGTVLVLPPRVDGEVEVMVSLKREVLAMLCNQKNWMSRVHRVFG